MIRSGISQICVVKIIVFAVGKSLGAHNRLRISARVFEPNISPGVLIARTLTNR